MSKSVYYLDQYPFGEIAEKCENYIRSFNWDKISDDIGETNIVHFDVSDCVDVFKHLQLDDDYQLICYVSREYHGMLEVTCSCGRCTAEGGHKYRSRTIRENVEYIEMSVIEEMID